ncbi:MAG: hypothetical protein PUF63_08790, partial [Prevotella sp.]|nr:hypothetical protein [Prevotella sp.]
YVKYFHQNLTLHHLRFLNNQTTQNTFFQTSFHHEIGFLRSRHHHFADKPLLFRRYSVAIPPIFRCCSADKAHP